jgi:hypothetical protein
MSADGPKTRPSGGKASRRSISAEGVYRGSVRAFSFVFLILGLVILTATLVSGGGPLSVGVLMGVAFAAVGAGRLWASSRMGL